VPPGLGRHPRLQVPPLLPHRQGQEDLRTNAWEGNTCFVYCICAFHTLYHTENPKEEKR
jgi:hypothetical protein